MIWGILMTLQDSMVANHLNKRQTQQYTILYTNILLPFIFPVFVGLKPDSDDHCLHVVSYPLIMFILSHRLFYHVFCHLSVIPPILRKILG